MKKTLTGILTFTLALVMLLGMCSFASAEAAINDDYLESIRTPDAFRVDTP